MADFSSLSDYHVGKHLDDSRHMKMYYTPIRWTEDENTPVEPCPYTCRTENGDREMNRDVLTA